MTLPFDCHPGAERSGEPGIHEHRHRLTLRERFHEPAKVRSAGSRAQPWDNLLPGKI